MQSKDNIQEMLHDDIAGEAKAHEDKKKFNHDERVFVTVKGTTSKHVMFLGKQYTHKQFEYMLRFMSKGMFMYPATLTDTDKPEGEDKVKGFVISHGLTEIENNKDEHLVKLTDDYKKAYEAVKLIRTHGRYKAIFNDSYITAVMDNLSHTARRESAVHYLNKEFVDFAKKYVCDHCGIISVNKALKTKDREGVESKILVCPDCSKELLRPNTKIADKNVGRNEPCPCGSNRKYKRCCINKKD